MEWPSSDDPYINAFIIGFFIPFISSLLGAAIALVRSILKKVDN